MRHKRKQNIIVKVIKAIKNYYEDRYYDDLHDDEIKMDHDHWISEETKKSSGR